MDENPQKILVAEDEESMYRLISFKLETAGFKVEVAEEGTEAWNKLQANNYSVVVLDLMLPQLAGMQILRRVRAKKIPVSVLILSAKSQEQDVLSGLEGGADDYLTKPFRPNELVVRVKKLVEGRQGDD